MKRYFDWIAPLLMAVLIHACVAYGVYWDISLLIVFSVCIALVSLQNLFIRKSKKPILVGGAVLAFYFVIGIVTFFVSDDLARLRLEGVLQENAFPWLALLTIGVLSFALPALDKLLDRLKRPSWLTNRVTAAGVSVLTLLLLTVCFGVLGKWGPAKGNRFVAWGVAFTVLTVMIIAVYDRAKRISSRKSFLRVAFYGAQGIILAVLSVLAYLVPRPDGVSVLRWDSLGWLCLFASLGILAMAIGFVVADLTVLLVGVLGNKIGVNPTEGSAAA